MSVMLRLKMAVHFRSVQLSSHLFIYLSLGQLCLIIEAALQTKCLETTTDITFMIKLTAHLNLEIIATIQLIKFTFERVEEFKYLGTTLTNQNSIVEEINSRLRSGNACYHSVQNLLSSRLLSKNLKTKVYRTIILPVVCMGEKLGR